MPEVFGLCKSCDDNVMIIVDSDNDDIEMVHTGASQKIIDYFKSLVGKYVSYYYDQHGVKVKIIRKDEPTVQELPSGLQRTLQSVLDTNKFNNK